MEPRGFGRRHAEDLRDLAHLTRAAPRAGVSRFWRSPAPGDQGQHPHCVGWAWWHFLVAEPRWWDDDGRRALPAPTELYRQAQDVDEWDGPPPAYDGTSVRAGAKVLAAAGLVSGYVWAITVDDAIGHVQERGPLVVGTAWFSRMTDVGPAGYAVPKGRFQGFHAYLLRGWDDGRESFRILNSWGPSWGERDAPGEAWLAARGFERLLNDRGEACSALETEGA